MSELATVVYVEKVFDGIAETLGNTIAGVDTDIVAANARIDGLEAIVSTDTERLALAAELMASIDAGDNSVLAIANTAKTVADNNTAAVDAVNTLANAANSAATANASDIAALNAKIEDSVSAAPDAAAAYVATFNDRFAAARAA